MDNKIDLTACTLPLFATPVVNYSVAGADSLNADLQALILELEQASPGVKKSNVGGWHSSPDLFQGSQKSIKRLHQRLSDLSLTLVNQFFYDSAKVTKVTKDALRLEAWANVLRHGQYNTLHCHPNALWSGVYFVTTNESIEEHALSGKLELIDPRPGASLNYEERSNLYGRFLVSPIAGQVIIFPAWLQHQVHPYFGRSKRISIAFNVLVS